MRHMSVLICLILVLASPAFASWEVGIDLGRSQASAPAYVTPSKTFIDVFGDHYTMTASQKEVSSPIVLGLDGLSPVLRQVGPIGIRLRVQGSLYCSDLSNADDSTSFLTMVMLGPTAELPIGKGRIEAGVFYARGHASFAACQLPSAYYGDPGYASPSYWVAPGTDIRARVSKGGQAYSIAYKLPLKTQTLLKVEYLRVVDLKLSEYEYSAEGKYGGGVTFSLPQLRPIDLSGSVLRLGLVKVF